MQQETNDARIPVREKSTRKHHVLYFSLVISPITWFKCFTLIFYRTRARSRSIALVQYCSLLLILLLMGASCYLFYAVTDDGSQYNVYLANVASNMTSMAEGRRQFDELIWRTVLKIFFLGVIYGLVQACNLFLAAQWRQRLCDRFQELWLGSPNGYLLYEMSRTDDDIPKVIANDIKSFTSSFATMLFGSMFFMGFIPLTTLIIIISVMLVRTSNGDASGVLICFVAFIFCVLIVLPATQLYNWNLLKQSQVKSRVRGYTQRLQANAECIVLYASQRVELKYIERLVAAVRNSMLIGSIGFALLNFPLQLLGIANGVCIYTMPSVVFFFVRSTQTPELAASLLAAVPFYSLLITLLTFLLFLMEYALVTVTLGDHLWTMLNRLETLAEQHSKRIAYEQENSIRQEDPNTFTLRHLNISVPDAVNVPLLQSDVNLKVTRGQCVLVSGPSGCGKTSLFRICARLQSVDGKQIILPERRHLLFIPQRPYLPPGSLRFQALLLLREQKNISDSELFHLFQSVNLQYLLERYGLDAVIDWPVVLSVGEQQRLAFVRLFALFTLPPNKDQLVQDALVLFDESTSAIDAKTEHEIYEYLTQLRLWFITISHRATLVEFHAESLEFARNRNRQQSIQSEHRVSVSMVVEGDNNNSFAQQKKMENIRMDTKQFQSNSAIKSDDILNTDERNPSKWKLAFDIFKFLHLPFQSNDNKLKVQTIIAWILNLVVLGLGNWCLYIFTDRTGTLFNGLSSYASGSSSVAEAKELVKSNIGTYIVLVVATAALYSLVVAGGRVLAALYTRRQMVYLARLLLDSSAEEYENNLLYHSRDLSVIPNFLASEIADLNNEVFNFLFGHVYYTGIISQIAFGVALSILLGKQDGGSTTLLALYLSIFGFFLIITLLSVLFSRWNIRDDVGFAQFVNAHKRVDLQAEQIAFSGDGIWKAEQDELRQKLDSSVRLQTVAGFFFSVLVGFARMSTVNMYLISFGVPAGIFFHARYNQGVEDPTTANAFLNLSVYIINLYFYWNYLTFLGDPLTRIESIGTRVVRYLEQLQQIDKHHRRLAIEEHERGRRVIIKPKLDDPCIVLKQVNVRIPQSSHILISDVNLMLFPSDNLIITGSSGCGKSTLLRLLAGIVRNDSDNENSVLRILPRRNIMFLCQQLHLIKGTLREQLCYLRKARGCDSVVDDKRAQQLLQELRLGHLLDRYSMDGERHAWADLLSIGEQQRLMLVSAFLVGTETIQLFVLDETTSGCDKQTEQVIYEYLQRSQIQFISISHRKTISKYHSCNMTIDAECATVSTLVLNTRL